MFDLITGHQGVAHISAEQIATLNKANTSNGDNKVVRMKDGAITVNALTLVIGTGYWRVNGYDMENQENLVVNIDPTSVGLSRKDGIYVEVLQDIPSGTQRSEIVVVKGTESATPSEPSAPIAPELTTDLLIQCVKVGIATVSESTLTFSDATMALETPVGTAEFNSAITDINDEFSAINNVYGAKNMILFDDDDLGGAGKVVLDGTAGTVRVRDYSSVMSDIVRVASITLAPGNYVLSKAPLGASEDTYWIEVWDTTNNIVRAQAYEEDEEFSLENTTNVDVYLMSKPSYYIDDVTFEPMLRLKAISNDSFVPGAKTNKELTEDTRILAAIGDNNDKYSELKSYKVGDLVIQNNKVYECSTPCNAGTWATNSGCFTATSLTKAVTTLNASLTWKLAGTLDSGHTSLSTPSTYEEMLLILGNGDNTVGTSVHIPKLNVTATGRTFRSGYYADGSHYGALDVHVSSSFIDSLTVKLNGSIDSNAKCAVYYR